MHTSAVSFSLYYLTLTVVTKPRIIQGPSQAAITSKPLEGKPLSKSFFDISATSAHTQ